MIYVTIIIIIIVVILLLALLSLLSLSLLSLSRSFSISLSILSSLLSSSLLLSWWWLSSLHWHVGARRRMPRRGMGQLPLLIPWSSQRPYSCIWRKCSGQFLSRQNWPRPRRSYMKWFGGIHWHHKWRLLISIRLAGSFMVVWFAQALHLGMQCHAWRTEMQKLDHECCNAYSSLQLTHMIYMTLAQCLLSDTEWDHWV